MSHLSHEHHMICVRYDMSCSVLRSSSVSSRLDVHVTSVCCGVSCSVLWCTEQCVAACCAVCRVARAD